MSALRFDLAVIGSGFGGSLLAICAKQRGLSVALLDRAAHPRFAIGESSTPIANLLLDRIATDFDLPWLRPFARYGDWKRAYPAIPCGPKRGFAYVHHAAGECFSPRADHANELLVGSNPDEARADCQWLRADFDAFIHEQACRSGVVGMENVRIRSVEHEAGASARWHLDVERNGETATIAADFAVDATGGGVLQDVLGIPSQLDAIQTSSRTIYAHFENVRRWSELYDAPGAGPEDHPFRIDDATLHHVFDGGWMWVIRFDHGVTSAGFCPELDAFPLNQAVTPADDWAALLRRFPSIAWQFADARAVSPIMRTGRIQRFAARTAGDDWAMLPTTAGFIDAFFSTGNAHTLLGVMRLASILTDSKSEADRARRLAGYDALIRREVQAIDRLVHGCFRSFHDMNRLAVYSMLYFLAATTNEDRMRRGDNPAHDGFLLAKDGAFQTIILECRGLLADASNRKIAAQPTSQLHLDELRNRAAAYNFAGLCDQSKRNMYAYSTTDSR